VLADGKEIPAAEEFETIFDSAANDSPAEAM